MTKLLTTPAPEQVAPCTTYPKAYDIPSTKIIGLRGQQWLASKLCGDCPLLVLCAQYALETLESRRDCWDGMVIAGVPFPDRASKLQRAAAERALVAVERGKSLSKAYDTQNRIAGDE